MDITAPLFPDPRPQPNPHISPGTKLLSVLGELTLALLNLAQSHLYPRVAPVS